MLRCAVLRRALPPQVMEAVEGNRVLEHILMRNKVLDGDNYVLHVQVCFRVLDAGWGGGCAQLMRGGASKSQPLWQPIACGQSHPAGLGAV